VTAPPPTIDSTQATPRTPAPSLPATSAVTAPAAEPEPAAEPGPNPVSSTPPATPPVTAGPARAPAPQEPGQAAGAAQAPVLVTSGQASPGAVQATPSPQAGACTDCRAAKPHHKKCWLLTWIHSLHQRAPEPKCQLPPATFPTTYQTRVPGPRPTSQAITGLIHPAAPSPQAAAPSHCACSAKAHKAPCFSWLHYGMASDFFAKLRSWRHGCACRCHDSEFRFWPRDCKRCATMGGVPTATLASPQARVIPVQPKSQLGLSSSSPLSGDLPERTQVLERIASQGLGETP
jgi:hypothetical protein